MNERRSLVEGLKQTPAVDPKVEREFVRQSKSRPGGEGASADAAASRPATEASARAPISTRIRADYAAALKRASLERQLSGVKPNTLQDILEEAIGPWLESNGYMT